MWFSSVLQNQRLLGTVRLRQTISAADLLNQSFVTDSTQDILPTDFKGKDTFPNNDCRLLPPSNNIGGLEVLIIKVF